MRPPAGTPLHDPEIGRSETSAAPSSQRVSDVTNNHRRFEPCDGRGIESAVRRRGQGTSGERRPILRGIPTAKAHLTALGTRVGKPIALRATTGAGVQPPATFGQRGHRSRSGYVGVWNVLPGPGRRRSCEAPDDVLAARLRRWFRVSGCGVHVFRPLSESKRDHARRAAKSGAARRARRLVEHFLATSRRAAAPCGFPHLVSRLTNRPDTQEHRDRPLR
jgi:hypothetical protein